MPANLRSAAWAVVALYTAVTVGQVTTKCNPLTATCPPDRGLDTSYYSVDFTQVNSLPSDWVLGQYGNVTYNTNGRNNGAEFAFLKQGDNPYLETSFYFLFGRIEYVVQAAPGPGMCSAATLLSDDLDEIDWEYRPSYPGIIQNNWFGQGVTGTYNHTETPNITDATTTFHTYAFDWQKDALSWYIDGNLVRTLKAADCVGPNNIYPQSPSKVTLSLWDPGNPSSFNPWAGEKTPIPPPSGGYTMYVKSVTIWNSSPAGSYTYSDKSGTWQSIKANGTVVNPVSQVSQSATQVFSTAPAYSSTSSFPNTSQLNVPVSVSTAAGFPSASAYVTAGGQESNETAGQESTVVDYITQTISTACDTYISDNMTYTSSSYLKSVVPTSVPAEELLTVSEYLTETLPCHVCEEGSMITVVPVATAGVATTVTDYITQTVTSECQEYVTNGETSTSTVYITTVTPETRVTVVPPAGPAGPAGSAPPSVPVETAAVPPPRFSTGEVANTAFATVTSGGVTYVTSHPVAQGVSPPETGSGSGSDSGNGAGTPNGNGNGVPPAQQAPPSSPSSPGSPVGEGSSGSSNGNGGVGSNGSPVVGIASCIGPIASAGAGSGGCYYGNTTGGAPAAANVTHAVPFTGGAVQAAALAWGDQYAGRMIFSCLMILIAAGMV